MFNRLAGEIVRVSRLTSHVSHLTKIVCLLPSAFCPKQRIPKMRELTIYCTEELRNQVDQILHRCQVDDYIHMPGLYGNKLKVKGSFEKDLTYPASAFLVYATKEKTEQVVTELKAYANQCSVKPCLRMAVSVPEQVF
jgi:hypothetical protein